MVALRKESVDRNYCFLLDGDDIACVALRKESVDRNIFIRSFVLFLLQSLSARRAWIEIACGPCKRQNDSVALRKESVDRNVALVLAIASGVVALRKESVDRNMSVHA